VPIELTNYIVSGFVSRKCISALPTDNVLFSDALLSHYLNMPGSGFSDLKYVASESNLETISDDNRLIDRIWDLLVEKQVGSSFECFSFILGYTCIEIGKVIKFLENTDGNYVIVCKESYKKLFLKVLDGFQLSGRVTFKTVEVGFLAEMRYILYHRHCTFYGKYNYLFYVFGLLWKLSRWRDESFDIASDAPIMLDKNPTSKAIQMAKFPGHSVIDLDEFMKVPFMPFLFGYVTLFRNANAAYFSRENKEFIAAHPGMRFLFRFIFAPFLVHFSLCNAKRVGSLPRSTVILQASDMSPHRHIFVQICNGAGLDTIVGQHGEISEPVVISKFVSSRAILTSKSTFDLYQAANENKFVELFTRRSTSDDSLLKKTNVGYGLRKKIYVLTCSFSGMSFDLNFSFNVEMIKTVLMSMRQIGDDRTVVVKLHPSESPALYKPHFDSLEFVTARLSDCISDIGIAIVGPSTSLKELSEDGVPVYYFAFGLQARHGFPGIEKQIDLEDFIKNS